VKTGFYKVSPNWSMFPWQHWVQKVYVMVIDIFTPKSALTTVLNSSLSYELYRKMSAFGTLCLGAL